ncbi:MAG: IS30 family transposase, partial [Ornithinibacter sp.]
ASQKTPISARPAAVLDRREAGHWEGDLIVGRYGRSHLVTLVERHSRYLLALPIKDATSGTVITAVADAFARLPEPMRKTLTWDRGVEMTRHAEFTETTGIPVYFCNAYSPWQRGSNENTNGLLRQYFPKGTDLSFHGPGILANVAEELNNRPRKRHHWATPAEELARLLSEQPNPGVSLTS